MAESFLAESFRCPSFAFFRSYTADIYQNAQNESGNNRESFQGYYEAALALGWASRFPGR